MPLKELFKPTKEKIILDILISLLLIIIIVLSVAGLQPIHIVIMFLASVVIFYPLASSIFFLYELKKNKNKSEKLARIVAILFIIFLNPISISLTMGLIHFGIEYANRINNPCGIVIVGFADNSSARDAGISIGEIILKVDNVAVNTIDALHPVLASKKPGDYITIKTNINTYSIQIAHPKNLGVYVEDQQKYCYR